MLFNSVQYLVFLAFVYFAWWGLQRAHNARLAFLLGASYVFYAAWSPLYLLLIIGLTLVDWLAGLALAGAGGQASRRQVLAAAVSLNLLVLGVFKYANFFISNARELSQGLGLDVPLPLLRVLLPVGISFYTFQGIAYVVDVYRRKIEPEPSPLRFALFLSFFTQLVAGPIVRAADLLPQIKRPRKLLAELGGQGIVWIVVGMFKKVVMADLLAVHLVDRVFDLPARFSSLEVLAAAYGYAFQIYFDFSGYTDIAIGSAMLLGFRLPANFDAPYRAASLRDFWRRWHISLSTWLRDYLYIPLGGSRRGRVALTLLITMLLGGLWHGAAWTFVLWGSAHGIGLVVNRAWQSWRKGRRERADLSPDLSEGLSEAAAGPGRYLRAPERRPLGFLGRAAGTFFTFNFVTAAWVLFRSETLAGAMDVYAQLFAFLPGHANLSPLVLALLGGAVALHALPRRWEHGLTAVFVRLPSPLQALVMVAAAWAITRLASGTPTPFVYFQF